MTRTIEFKNARGGHLFIVPDLIEAVIEGEYSPKACELRTTTGHNYFIEADAGKVLEAMEAALRPSSGIVDLQAAEKALAAIISYYKEALPVWDERLEAAVELAHKAIGSTKG